MGGGFVSNGWKETAGYAGSPSARRGLWPVGCHRCHGVATGRKTMVDLTGEHQPLTFWLMGLTGLIPISELDGLVYNHLHFINSYIAALG